MKSPLLSYVMKHPLIQPVERAFDFHPKSIPEQKDAATQYSFQQFQPPTTTNNSGLANIVELTMYMCADEECGCMKSFNNIRAFQQHNRDLEALKTQKYKCEICDKCFTRKEKLTAHSKVHNPAKKQKK